MWIIYIGVTFAIAVMSYNHGKYTGSKEAWTEANDAIKNSHRRR